MASINQRDWRDNFLACYPAIIERLQAVRGVKKVCEATDFAALSKKQAPLDGVVYVIFDSVRPKAANQGHREQMLEIGFSIILTKTNLSMRAFGGDGQADSVGVLLTSIAKAMQGFVPMWTDEHGNSEALVDTAFTQQNGLPVQYLDGFAYFPLRFVAQVQLVSGFPAREK